MVKYKKFLNILLAVNLLFIFTVAGLGYVTQSQKNEATQVSNEIKNVQDNKKVIPVGKTVGIYVNTKGILVIDTGTVTNISGKEETPAKNKLMSGDYITSLNGEKMKTKKQLVETITKCNGEELIFDVNRNSEKIKVSVTPVASNTDEYKVGIWVKDDLQGLGTVTYIDGEKFGALGHSINDSDTGTLLKVNNGEIYEADLFGVEKSTAGSPGEIEGMIAYQTEKVVGSIDENCLYGIYGTVTSSFKEQISINKAIPIAKAEEVTKGKAYIQSYVSGEKKLYEIEIVNIHKNKNGDQEMEIAVTDKDLIDLTGGIVQGMSGSPIIQDDKLVGAVTHVFVDDPIRGYGIFAETMLKQEK